MVAASNTCPITMIKPSVLRDFRYLAVYKPTSTAAMPSVIHMIVVSNFSI